MNEIVNEIVYNTIRGLILRGWTREEIIEGCKSL